MGGNPRTYVVGLPVAVTVHDDGTVEWSTDVSETGPAMQEEMTDENREPLAVEAELRLMLDAAAVQKVLATMPAGARHHLTTAVRYDPATEWRQSR